MSSSTDSVNLANLPTTINCALPDWGVIAIHGADAAALVHNQLTQDFLLLSPNQARLAAWCSPKGRILVSFYGIKPQAEEVLLLCPLDSVAWAAKRLSLFVLRSQCTVRDASSEWQVLGHIQTALAAQAADIPMPLRTGAGSHAIALPTVAWQQQLWQRTLELRSSTSLASEVPAGSAQDAEGAQALALWQQLQIASGIALVSAPVREAFVPQMLNYESVGGINFKKGCYPGQEVVARSQFRGQIKRRAFVVQSPVPLSPGQEVHNGQGDALGLVAQCAAWSDGSMGIVSVQSDAAAAGLYCAGAALTVLPLPYSLKEDI